MAGNGDQGGGRGLTRQRRAVLDAVRGSEGHLTAQEVYEAARRLLPTISLASVYNSLKYLTESGLIREVALGKNASRYDRTTERHDHAVCSRCGRLVDFELAEAAALLRAAARRSKFKPESVHLTLVGVCPDCQRGA
ncbi:MAG TPA: transcriptional repressor [Pyrinomonadaceae bacterium]|nr:transcriptional repressor [Pyrinomonadaceae bacterium]